MLQPITPTHPSTFEEIECKPVRFRVGPEIVQIYNYMAPKSSHKQEAAYHLKKSHFHLNQLNLLFLRDLCKARKL